MSYSRIFMIGFQNVRTSFFRYFLNLASRLGAGMRIEGEIGDLFFNLVKIVKFIMKSALNMNNTGCRSAC